MSCLLQQQLYKNLDSLRGEFFKFKTHNYKTSKIADITVNDLLFRGSRGIPILFTNVSGVNRECGQYIRNKPLQLLCDKDPIDIFFLSMTGDYLIEKEKFLTELCQMERVDEDLISFVKSLISDGVRDPMKCLSIIMLYMSNSSNCNRDYAGNDIGKMLHLAHAIADVKRIYAIIPNIIALLYSELENVNISTKSWKSGYNHKICSCLNISYEFEKIIQNYIIAHSGQGKGNVAGHIGHLTYSVGNNIYECLANSITALGGHKHAASSMNSVKLINYVRKAAGTNLDDKVVQNLLAAWLEEKGHIPGFGQAVMKHADPRFNILYHCGKEILYNSGNEDVIKAVIDNVPQVFYQRNINISNSSPNVNLISGTILGEIGIKNSSFYPVMFFLGRMTDLMSQYIENLIFSAPVERPSSLNSEELVELVKGP